MNRKIITALLLMLVIGSVLFLALQGPKETTALSSSVWQWAKKLGYNGTHLQFRSDIHIIEYFIVGTTTVLFCAAMGWKPWTGFLAACFFGLLEETLKNFLPTREFSRIDVFKDFLGAALALLLILVISSIHKRRSYSHISEESNHSQGRRSAEWERI